MMICPLMSRPTHDFRDGLNEIECKEDACAWWMDEYSLCAAPMLVVTAIEKAQADNAAGTASMCQKLGDAILAETRKKRR